MRFICVACGKRMYKTTTAILTGSGIMCYRHYMKWVFDRISLCPYWTSINPNKPLIGKCDITDDECYTPRRRKCTILRRK